MSTPISVPPQMLLERILTLELVRVTERAAVSAARLRGHGQEKPADQAAVDAMRRELNKLPIEGTIVIGEGERDEAPMLFIGEKVGLNAGPKVDIAVELYRDQRMPTLQFDLFYVAHGQVVDPDPGVLLQVLHVGQLHLDRVGPRAAAFGAR